VSSTEPVVIRPRKVRRVAWVMAPVIVVFFVVLGILLTGPTGNDDNSVFKPSDQIAMGLLGVLLAGGVLMIGRPRVLADQRHVKIQNIIGGYDLPWDVVRAVRFDRGSPWLTLELENDDIVAVMAIQATDKELAVTDARTLRTLLAANIARRPVTVDPP
jgi:hypothetical protein